VGLLGAKTEMPICFLATRTVRCPKGHVQRQHAVFYEPTEEAVQATVARIKAFECNLCHQIIDFDASNYAPIELPLRVLSQDEFYSLDVGLGSYFSSELLFKEIPRLIRDFQH
jgi:hypothetical protein